MPLHAPKGLNFTLTEGLKTILKDHDANHDGRLSRDELKKAFKDLNSRFPGWRAGRALHHADKDGDGSISTEELDELVDYVKKLGYGLK